ncbi:hypothetical protein COEREDRAFT_79505 [Coemansia reversa NRRL 1564]|uniref:Uncharacterized protein n=1 Tax=Coemansia reversa (strain ATCC 12441 / NRRL 1564) TaxID=763665 RepID=A0A2G5BIZ5_COERN|nr:hypothetical protein COEREDRAFT_79505 [Coemansia reversa NRRL 1564]|eukprot:PIA18988.1 hypothetical protein COEREDRAFT_79505 [Coemansia reversa NRRL 1564]
MNVGTRSRAKTTEATSAQQRQSPGASPTGTAGAEETPTPTQAEGDENSASVNIPMQNIRQFKETVVNTSRLLKVFSDQEKELGRTKAELAKQQEDIKRMHTAHQSLQREIDARARELAGANAETENARSLLQLREEELSRVRGLKEDLETKLTELRQAAPTIELSAPPKSPNTVLLEEIEQLKKDLQAKDGSLKSLRISRDSIRSSTKAEIMSIQAKYAREQKELIERQEKEMTVHRASLADKEAELEQEQERLMQLEMDLSMRETQMEDQAAELKASADKASASFRSAQLTIKRLEEEAKARNSEHRTETNRLQRKGAKDEKAIASLEAQVKRLQANARTAKESARAGSRHRPRSTAAEAVIAATEDVAAMSMEELRSEVARLRSDAVHTEETIRRLTVRTVELEREQNPEGPKRSRVGALQTEIKRLNEEVDARDKKIGAFAAALNLSEWDADKDATEIAEAAAGSGSASAGQAAATIAQLNIKVISLEKTIQEREHSILRLEAELEKIKEEAEERPRRLRHASTPTSHHSVGLNSDSGGRRALRVAGSPDSQCEKHYAEIATLRTKTDRLQQDRLALQELVTEQQVKLRQLRSGTSSQPTTSTPTPAQRKRGPQITMLDETPTVTVSTSKRARRDTPSSGYSDSSGAVAVVKVPRRKPTTIRSKQITAGVTATPALSDTQNLQFSGRQGLQGIVPALTNKRIRDVTRAKRAFDIAISSPLELQTSLARLSDMVPPLDAARFAELIVTHIDTEAARASSIIELLPNTRALGTSDMDANEHNLAAARLQDLVGNIQPSLYCHEATMSLSIWTLILRSEQDELYPEIMRMLSQSIVLRANSPAQVSCSLTRIFVVLGLLAADIQRVRTMLCDLLMEAVDGPHALPVLANTLAIWPDVLSVPATDERSTEGWQSFSLVVRVFQAIAAGIHDLYTEERGKDEANKLYDIMVKRCGWRMPGNAEFADNLLVEVKEALSTLERDSADYPVVMAAFNLLSPYVV